jgi:hypothetical protein
VKIIKIKYFKTGMLNKVDSVELFNGISTIYDSYDRIYLNLNNSQCSIEFIKYLYHYLWSEYGIDEVMNKIIVEDSKVMSKIEIIGSIYA